MTRRSLPLAERLRQGLASAVLSAAALAAPSADAATPQQQDVAQSLGNASRPAVRGQASKPPQSKPPQTTSPKTAAPKAAPAAKPKSTTGGKTSPAAAAGCGAHDGGCGPSR